MSSFFVKKLQICTGIFWGRRIGHGKNGKKREMGERKRKKGAREAAKGTKKVVRTTRHRKHTKK